MKPLLLVLVVHIPIWIFHFSLISAIRDPFVSSISGPASSPAVSPTSPISTSMAAFSPGIQLRNEEQHRMDPHKNLLMLLTVLCASLGAIIACSVFALWYYVGKCSLKFQRDAEKGVFLAPFLGKFNSVEGGGRVEYLGSGIDHKMLEKATDNFCKSKILGEGRFGRVYKARLEENLVAAVKKINRAGEDAQREFENEVILLSQIKHPNIISLLGFSTDGETGYIVYELMENGSLESQLHGPSRGSALTWHLRMKIAMEVAKGLQYLHDHCNPPVIHRDLKSANILLDANYNAKLSDFGFAIIQGVQNEKVIKISGTVGYVDPEYLSDGKLTDKSDVYAFGVVLLELLLGRRPIERVEPVQCQSLVTWAMPQLTDRNVLPNIVDPAIKGTMDLKHLFQVAAVAVLCVQREPGYRPLITDVLHSLVPLVPVDLGGTLRSVQTASPLAPVTPPCL